MLESIEDEALRRAYILAHVFLVGEELKEETVEVTNETPTEVPVEVAVEAPTEEVVTE